MQMPKLIYTIYYIWQVNQQFGFLAVAFLITYSRTKIFFKISAKYPHTAEIVDKDIYENQQFYLPSNSSPAVSLEGATLMHLRLTLKEFQV